MPVDRGCHLPLNNLFSDMFIKLKLIFIINVNTKWRASLIYICIFIKGRGGGHGFFVF